MVGEWSQLFTCIMLLSMAFSPIDMNDVMFVKRWHKTMEKSISSSPILVHYQPHMRGVDVADQLWGYHMVQNKDHKWWHHLFMHIHDMSLVNSWVMYRSNIQEKCEKKSSLRESNYAIEKKLLLFAKRPVTTCTTESGVRNAHILHCSMMWSGLKERKRRNCWTCSKSKQQYCPTCDDQTLYLGQCFVTWHAK